MSMPEPPVTTDADDFMPITIDPIPVFIAKDETREQAAHFGSLQSFTVPVAGTLQPTQILNRRPSRNTARIYNPSLNPNPAASGASLNGRGSVTNPGTFAGIAVTGAATVSGYYNITVTTMLTGTATAADGDNMQAGISTGAWTDLLVTPPVVNVPVTQTFTEYVPAGATLNVISGGAASGIAATYNASIIATPAPNVEGSPVLLSTRPDVLQGPNPVNGFLMLPGTNLEFVSQQAVWAIVPVGGSLINLSVLDQAWATEQ